MSPDTDRPGRPAEDRPAPGRHDPPAAPRGSAWVRVGGGFELVPGGARHGPAEPGLPPPGGPWEPVPAGGVVAGWVPAGEGGRSAAHRLQEESARIELARRDHLLGRLGHKLRSSVLILQESARQAAFGRPEQFEQLYDQAQEVGRRAAALEAVAVASREGARAVVLGAVLNLAAPGASRDLPGDAVVRASETQLVEALTRAYEWMGGPGTGISGRLQGGWWRLELRPAPGRRPLPVPEVGEPLVRLLVENRLDGYLDTSDPAQVLLFLPAL